MIGGNILFNLFSRPRPVWFYLIALCGALTIPILVVTALMTWNFAESERTRLKGDVSNVNLQVMSALERQQAADIAMMRVLATSPALRDDDIGSFRVQAHAILRSDLVGAEIILQDAAGNTLLDTGEDTGRISSTGKLNAPKLNQGRPTFSGLLVGRNFSNSAYFVTVPVKILDKVKYYLIARMPVQRLADLITEQNLDPGYFVSIADRSGILLARSAENEKHFGRQLPGVTASEGRDFFTWSGNNPQGVKVYGVIRREKLNGWAVTTGISQQLLHAPLNRSLLWFLGLAAIAITIGYIVAYTLSRILSGTVRKIIAIAGELGEGKQVEPIITPVTDANIIGVALKAAYDKLRQQSEALVSAKKTLERRVEERTEELAAKTKLLQTTLSNMDQGLLLVDRKGFIRLHNAKAADLIEVPEQMLRTHPNVSEAVNYQKRIGIIDEAPEDVAIMFSRHGLVPGQTTVHERERPNGKVIEVRTVPLDDGSLVRTYTDVTLRKHAERHLQFLARHNSLTEIPNRLHFRERLEQAISFDARYDAPLSVLFIDVDHFKSINDIHGHAVGDALLIQIAARLKSELRMEDTVARFGGDEFAVLQAGGAEENGAANLARRLLRSVSGTYSIDDIALDVTVSIGIAACQAQNVGVDELMRKADTALYQAKRSGRNRFCQFEEFKIALAAG